MSKILRDISLRDFGASLNTVESYTNESSQGKIGLCETVNKQKCTHLGMFLAAEHTRFSLFKFFIDNKFIGETCTEDENYWKIFEYQFNSNGSYKIGVSAYSSFYEPSEKTWISVTINNIDNAVLTDAQNNKLTDEKYILLTE